MSQSFDIRCECGTVAITLTGEPRVRGHCHCQACRTLLNTPYHSVTAWNADQLETKKGADHLKVFQHPHLSMKKAFCRECGEVLFNTNAMDWRVVSQHLIAKNSGGVLPAKLAPQSHFHYGNRVIDIEDDLPKRE